MIARVATVISAFLLAVSSAAVNDIDFEYGQRPTNAIFDPKDVLGAKASREISEPLARIHLNEGIDVIVVILENLADAPPEHVARLFAAAWCDTPIHAVVLHVPGRADSPWIVPNGKFAATVRPEVIDAAVAEARRNASREPDDAGKVRAATTEAADMLRYWTGNAIIRSEFIKAKAGQMRHEQEIKTRKWKYGLLLAASCAIPAIVGIAMVFLWFRKRRGSHRFPKPNVQRRLGAPHAGGNHAVVNLGPPIP